MVVDEGMGGMCLIDRANVVYDALYKFKCGWTANASSHADVSCCLSVM